MVIRCGLFASDPRRYNHGCCGAADGPARMLDLASGIATRLSHNLGSGDPVWSPAGRQLVFTVFDGFTGNLYRKVITGGGEELLFKSGETKRV
jgi:hypothetical protein